MKDTHGDKMDSSHGGSQMNYQSSGGSYGGQSTSVNYMSSNDAAGVKWLSCLQILMRLQCMHLSRCNQHNMGPSRGHSQHHGHEGHQDQHRHFHYSLSLFHQEQQALHVKVH